MTEHTRAKRAKDAKKKDKFGKKGGRVCVGPLRA